MPTTPRHSLPSPTLTDNPDVPEDVDALAEAADLLPRILYGATSPPASPANIREGDIYVQYT